MHILILIICGVIAMAEAQGYKYETGQSVPTSYTSPNFGSFRLNYFGRLPSATQSSTPTQYLNKQFFIHHAPPEDVFDSTNSPHQNILTTKKNIRVIFIKAPTTNDLTSAAEKLIQAQTSTKTVIYVLNKYTDVAELQNKLNLLKEVKPNKPEIHFIKYRTLEEANFAQQSIQAQYDLLNGLSQVSHEEAPPVLAFDSSLGRFHGSRFGHQPAVSGPDYSNIYLRSSLY